MRFFFVKLNYSFSEILLFNTINTNIFFKNVLKSFLVGKHLLYLSLYNVFFFFLFVFEYPIISSENLHKL